MTVIPISLGSGSNPSRVPAGGAARFINCYLEKQGEDAKAPSIVVASDGLAEFVTLPNGPIRAMIEVGAYLYVVADRTFYRVSSSGASDILGGVPTSGLVHIARNRRDSPHIGIVSGGRYWVCDTADGSYVEITASDIGVATFEPKSITVMDGYGILPVTSSLWYTSDLDDLMTIDPLEFAKAESNPDEIVTVATREGEVVIFGTRSTEFWQDTGDVDFAFKRSMAIELGCLAAGSVAKVDRTLLWIAHDGTVRVMNGYGGDRVSDYAVERAIASVDPNTITATTWWGRGHTFYAISSDDWTWVYDVGGEWHERIGYDLTRWSVAFCERFGNDLVAGASASGTLYKMSHDYLDEDGSPLIMTVQTPPVHAFPMRLAVSALYVDFAPGVGLATGASQDVAPELMVSYSDNGGQTWSAERRVSIGRQGDMLRRGILRRLGIVGPVGRTFKISASASVVRALLGAALDADKLVA